MSWRLSDCSLIPLPQVTDQRGSLSFVEEYRTFPHDLKRVYYLYDVPGGAERGGHAHREMRQLIIAVAGSFDVLLDDGTERRVFHLNRAYQGLYVCPMIWRELRNFSSGAVCLSLVSTHYDEADYIRDYAAFLEAARSSP